MDSGDMKVGKSTNYEARFFQEKLKTKTDSVPINPPSSDAVNKCALPTLFGYYASEGGIEVPKSESETIKETKLSDLKSNVTKVSGTRKLKVLSSFSSKILSTFSFVGKSVKEDLQSAQLEHSIKALSKNELKGRESRFITEAKKDVDYNELMPNSAVITIGIAKLLLNAYSEEQKLGWEEKSESKIAKEKEISDFKKDLSKILEPKIQVQTKLAMAVLEEYEQVQSTRSNTIMKALIEFQGQLKNTKNGEYIVGEPDEDDLFHSSEMVEEIENSLEKFQSSVPDNYKNKIFADIEEEFSPIIKKTKDDIFQYDLSVKTNTRDSASKTPMEIANAATERINNFFDKKLSPVILEIRSVTDSILKDLKYLSENHVPLSQQVFEDRQMINYQMQNTGLEVEFKGVISKPG